jgi:hypothetical protein
MMSVAAVATHAPDPEGLESESVSLKGRFNIWPDARIAALCFDGAEAFIARDGLNAEYEVFALACDPSLPPRLDLLPRLKELHSLPLIRLLDWAVVPWPGSGDHRFCLIYERPAAKRLVSDMAAGFEPMGVDDVVSRMMAPMIENLAAFGAAGVTHRAIRPDNMFMSKDGNDRLLLGDAASAPPAFHQPPAFETIESLMASPGGRGAGRPADDVYALGVSVLALVTGGDPAAGRSAAEVLENKIDRGSFGALVESGTLPPGLREAVRGMLADDPEHRWNFEDLQGWIADRRLKRSSVRVPDRAQRAFTLGSVSYHHPRSLAHAMARDWENVQLPQNGQEVLAWVRRAMGDDTMIENLRLALEASDRNLGGGDGTTVNPPFVARLAMALDRAAPVRYRHIAAHLDGFGSLLATDFGDQETVRAVTEALLEELPAFRHLMTAGADGSGNVQRYYARYARYLKSHLIGFGIERCLYAFNQLQFCRSPIIADQKVMELSGLLPALEKVSRRHPESSPLDRHIAAFAAAHISTDIQSVLEALSDPANSERGALGMLGLFATIQASVGGGPFPGLASWIRAHLGPVIDSYHHRVWREKVEAELPALVEAGDLLALYGYLSNGEARQRDRQGFAEARQEFAAMDAEIAFLKSNGISDPTRTRILGHQMASGISMLFGLGAIIFSVIFL